MGYDDIVIQGNPEEAKFVAYYCKGEDVVAVATVQKDPVMAQAAELMRRGGMLKRKELKEGGDILKCSVIAGVTV